VLLPKATSKMNKQKTNTLLYGSQVPKKKRRGEKRKGKGRERESALLNIVTASTFSHMKSQQIIRLKLRVTQCSVVPHLGRRKST
jgi:hypothetical protein